MRKKWHRFHQNSLLRAFFFILHLWSSIEAKAWNRMLFFWENINDSSQLQVIGQKLFPEVVKMKTSIRFFYRIYGAILKCTPRRKKNWVVEWGIIGKSHMLRIRRPFSHFALKRKKWKLTLWLRPNRQMISYRTKLLSLREVLRVAQESKHQKGP